MDEKNVYILESIQDKDGNQKNDNLHMSILGSYCSYFLIKQYENQKILEFTIIDDKENNIGIFDTSFICDLNIDNDYIICETLNSIYHFRLTSYTTDDFDLFYDENLNDTFELWINSYFIKQGLYRDDNSIPKQLYTVNNKLTTHILLDNKQSLCIEFIQKDKINLYNYTSSSIIIHNISELLLTVIYNDSCLISIPPHKAQKISKQIIIN